MLVAYAVAGVGAVLLAVLLLGVRARARRFARTSAEVRAALLAGARAIPPLRSRPGVGHPRPAAGEKPPGPIGR